MGVSPAIEIFGYAELKWHDEHYEVFQLQIYVALYAPFICACPGSETDDPVWVAD